MLSSQADNNVAGGSVNHQGLPGRYRGGIAGQSPMVSTVDWWWTTRHMLWTSPVVSRAAFRLCVCS